MSKIISVKNASFQIPYDKEVLSDVSMEVEEGEFVGILGVNGAGKSAFIDLLLGTMKPSKGKISVLGEDPFSESRVKREEVCYISQSIDYPSGATGEFALSLYEGLYPKYSKEMAKKLSKILGVDLKKKIGGLSLGQKKKIQVIAALSCKPKLLIVDEITAVFDERSRKQFFELVKKYREKHQLSIVLATNIASDLIEYTSKVMFIDNGHASFHPASDLNKLFDLSNLFDEKEVA